MKNIHILPTEKPSILYFWENRLRIGDLTTAPKNLGIKNQNIYITSDEEIKEGDWVIYQKFMFPLKVVLDQDGYHIISNGIGEIVGDYYSLQERYKKIIITTDQDLIKDGVQTIDDEFLEWFVKNPSCEEVKVEYNEYEMFGNKSKKWIDSHSCYEIIIPKEEPKQETLEEVAEKYVEHQLTGIYDKSSKFECLNDFIAGAKWQQEQDKKTYSEEEVRKISLDFFYHWWNAKGSNTEQGFDKWFEQVKKK